MLSEKEKTSIYQKVALTKGSTMIHLHFLEVLMAIHEELVKIREATETEVVEDSEPDPFQTLNGPSA